MSIKWYDPDVQYDFDKLSFERKKTYIENANWLDDACKKRLIKKLESDKDK